MQDLGILVEDPANAVAAVLAYHGVVVLLGVPLDDMADVPQGRAGFDHFQGQVEAFLGDLDQALGVGRHLAHLDHDAGVPVKLVLDDRHVDVDDVAIFEPAGVRGDAVADHVVDGGADRAGKAVVVQRCGYGLQGVGDVLVADAVDLPGGHTGLHPGLNHFQHLGGHAPGHSHLL